MDAFQVDTAAWAREQFGTADLGDRRRTERLIRVAARMAADPSASIPGQMEGWAETKAAYRLLDADGVSFEAIAAPHWRRTRACGPGRFLVLGDTTELDFGIAPPGPGPGPHRQRRRLWLPPPCGPGRRGRGRADRRPGRRAWSITASPPPRGRTRTSG